MMILDKSVSLHFVSQLLQCETFLSEQSKVLFSTYIFIETGRVQKCDYDVQTLALNFND